ncbi:MAG: hypothetical protein A3J24_01345 [Deltaproteobacteria bacterium RIFCSPLOWO2_02_FULL_53_8]|nr:MAG: hypothetical protein A3J24_01345 [Deltaproteobacteria bacterium RIFCSPLOWO2_02_FULL_53_8]
MALTKKEVFRVAELARLAVTDEQAEVYTAQLQRILGHVEKLSELDTSGVPASFAAVAPHGPMRDDIAHASAALEDTMNNAPLVERGCFKVPQVIE